MQCRVDVSIMPQVAGGDIREIRPGVSYMPKIMSRLAPDFIIRQLDKPIDRMLVQAKG
jgi:hypothetical protein